MLGRLSDNSWLYVKTPDGEEGWITMSWVDLAGVSLYHDAYPVTTPSPAQPAPIWVSGGRVNLRAGPGTNFSVIRKLAYDEQLLMLGRLSDNSWLYVKTPDGEEGWITMSWVYLARVNLYHDDYPFRMSPPTETSTPVVLDGIEGRWIDVDLSEQMLRAYDGADLVASFLVSTGIDLYPTETGQYHIYVKYLSSPMRGDDYYLPDVPYSLYYSGDFSIHGTYWHHNFGTPMSHGCINMDINDAKWLYHWSSIGTLVNIHR
jgi:lipoprotein-anchoring transpeptidase ErfK/SrfK